MLLCKKDFLDHDPSVEITKVAVNSYIYRVHLLGDVLAQCVVPQTLNKQPGLERGWTLSSHGASPHSEA